jgi:hypothetical protein
LEHAVSNPTPYTPSYDFSDFEASNPTVPKPGAQLDNEFENIAESLGETITALADIRRSDGALNNEIVTVDSLADDVLLLLGQGGTHQIIIDNIDNIITVADNIADVNLVADNMADVNLVADNIVIVQDFEQRYLGPKTADPTTRNDGSPLVSGDMYFNDTLDETYIWNGATWQTTSTKVNCVVSPITGNGTTGPYALLADPGSKNNTDATVGGVQQLKSSYSVSGATITFGAVVPVGVLGEVTSFVALPLDTPVDGSVTTAKIVDGSVTTAKIADANVTTAKIADANVTGAKLAPAIALPADATVPTPAQADTTTKVANMAALKRDRGNLSGTTSVTASTTLTIAQLGTVINISGSTAGQTITLPALATVEVGKGYWIRNAASVPFTLKGDGSENIAAMVLGSGQAAANTLTIGSGDTLLVFCAGGAWGEQQGVRYASIQAARAWVNFNGTGTVAIRKALNVSSITDNGVGDYTVNFTTALPDANYVPIVTPLLGSSANSGVEAIGPPLATGFRTRMCVNAVPTDFGLANIAFFD